MSLFAIIFQAFLSTAMAAEIATNLPDREKVEDHWFLLHSESFEYACNVEVKDDQNRSYESTLWLDVDFEENQSGYRVGLSFPENLKAHEYIGAELGIDTAQRGRCPGLCLSLSMQDGSNITFKQQTPDATIEVMALDTEGQEMLSGTCELNEPY